MRRFITIVDGVGVALAAALSAALFLRVARTFSILDPLSALCGLAFGFFAADAASGLVHWLCDTYFDPRTPLLGTILIAPFREHHADPGALARHGFLERNGNNCWAGSLLLLNAVSLLEPGAVDHRAGVLAASFFAAAALTVCAANQIHAWAHGARAPRAVRALQRARILITLECHARHHRGDRAYAVVSGWSNGLLDRGLAWVEMLLGAFGVRPTGSGAKT